MLGMVPAYERRLDTTYEGIDSIDETERKKRFFQFRNLSFVFYVPVPDVQS